MRWNFGSPLPYTRPVGQYFAWRHNPIWGQYEPAAAPEDEPPLYVVLGDRNAERYPPYHRLDATENLLSQYGNVAITETLG